MPFGTCCGLQREQKKRHKQPAIFPSYEIGDEVWILRFVNPANSVAGFCHPYIGPYVIVHKHSPYHYEVVDPDNPKDRRWCHVASLKALVRRQGTIINYDFSMVEAAKRKEAEARARKNRNRSDAESSDEKFSEGESTEVLPIPPPIEGASQPTSQTQSLQSKSQISPINSNNSMSNLASNVKRVRLSEPLIDKDTNSPSYSSNASDTHEWGADRTSETPHVSKRREGDENSSDEAQANEVNSLANKRITRSASRSTPGVSLAGLLEHSRI